MQIIVSKILEANIPALKGFPLITEIRHNHWDESAVESEMVCSLFKWIILLLKLHKIHKYIVSSIKLVTYWTFKTLDIQNVKLVTYWIFETLDIRNLIFRYW